MVLSQMLSQAHATTAGYNRNKFFVFALLCTNCFTLVTLYGTAPNFSGTLDLDDLADGDLRSSSGERGRDVGSGIERGISGLRFSNATDHTFKTGFGMQGFVYFSAYRISASLFVVIGLAPMPLHRNLDAKICRWYPATSSSPPIPGDVSVEYPGESHGKPYEVAMLFCQLSKPTPSTGGRGWRGEGRSEEGRGVGRSLGGHLTVVIEREEILVLGEPANQKLPIEPSSQYPSSITYCSSPIYGSFNPQRILEWVAYHRHGHGVDLFHFYDAGGMGEPIMRTLGPFIKAKSVTVTDVTEAGEFETWFGQVLVVNDCAYRSLFTSRWVLFLDFDEYLYVSEPFGSTLINTLANNQQAAFVSFGSLYFYTDKCSHSLNLSASAIAAGAPPRWEVERMIFRQADVHCVAPKRYSSRNLCLGFDGHRKYVADPRKVKLFGIHAVGKTWPLPATTTTTANSPTATTTNTSSSSSTDTNSINTANATNTTVTDTTATAASGAASASPPPARFTGVDFDVRDVHLNHYRGLNTMYIRSCTQFIHDTDWTPVSWARDFSLSHAAVAVRKRSPPLPPAYF